MDLELKVYAGANFRRDIRWRPEGVPLDLTTWSAILRAAPQRGQAASFDLTSPSDGLTLSADGIITIAMDAEQTEALPGPALFYVLDMRSPDGEVSRVLRGRLVVVRDVLVE